MILDMDYTNVTVPTTWSICTCPVQHVCETQHVFLQGLKNSTVWLAVLLLSTFCWPTVTATFICFDHSRSFAPTLADNINTFDLENGSTSQHPYAEGANSSGDSQDDHDNTGTPDPCGQHVPSVQSHQHGTGRLQRGSLWCQHGCMVVGIANRIIWGNDASNRRTGNIEGQQSQPQMGQADFIGNTLTGDVYPLFFHSTEMHLESANWQQVKLMSLNTNMMQQKKRLGQSTVNLFNRGYNMASQLQVESGQQMCLTTDEKSSSRWDWHLSQQSVDLQQILLRIKRLNTWEPGVCLIQQVFDQHLRPGNRCKTRSLQPMYSDQHSFATIAT